MNQTTSTPNDQPGGSTASQGDTAGTDRSKMAPGDEAPPGTRGTGEDICRCCGGSGKMDNGSECTECAGTGKVTVGIGGA